MPELVSISELRREPPYSTIFSIDPKVKIAIAENMMEFGFDESKPIDVWRQKMIVIDGNTRMEAAIEAGMDHVYVFYHDFRNDGEALEYAIHNQRNRRNLTDSELLRCIDALDRTEQRGGDTRAGQLSNLSELDEIGFRKDGLDQIKQIDDLNQPDSDNSLKSKTSIEVFDFRELEPINPTQNEGSANVTARIVGTSHAKVERARKVLNNPIKKEEVLSGEKTIHKAYTEIKEEEKVIPKSVSKFNKVNDNIEWSLWSWNPVTGCKQGCTYCYARDIANRFFPEKFEPTFHPDRLDAPKNTPMPSGTDGNAMNVFVCSMADLFGEWVPQEWIDQVVEAVRDNPQWNFLFLTKNPSRLIDIEWPQNAWVGTTVDIQPRVEPAKEAFRKINATVKFLSCEPLKEMLDFGDMSMFDWLIVGGQSKSSGEPEFQPEWRWVESLISQARLSGLKIYFKPNLTSRPKEYPKFQ